MCIVAYVVFEVTQVTNLVFKVGRFLKERIDFNQGFFQLPAMTIILVSGACFVAIMKLMVQDISEFIYDAEFELTWFTTFTIGSLVITLLGLMVMPFLIEGNDSIIMNGFLVATYIAYSTT